MRVCVAISMLGDYSPGELITEGWFDAGCGGGEEGERMVGGLGMYALRGACMRGCGGRGVMCVGGYEG